MLRQSWWVAVWGLLNGLLALIWFAPFHQDGSDSIGHGIMMAVGGLYAISTLAGTLFAGLRLSADGPEHLSRIKAVWAFILLANVTLFVLGSALTI